MLTLIMLGKLEEARQILAANWRLNAPPHANTTPRIAFLRHLIALLESPGTSRTGEWPAQSSVRLSGMGECPDRTGDCADHRFLGQLKTLLTGPELPVASDVAVPWDIDYFIGHLNAELGARNAEFLTALTAALNDRAKLPDLERFPEWKNQSPVPLDAG